MAPLEIAVVGVGAIGSAFAFQLVRTGHHEVTAVARPGSARLAQLQRDKAVVNTQGERAEVQVTDTLDEAVAYDLVIVTLLAHQADSVLPALQRSAAKCIQFMFNNFDPDRLLNAVGPKRSTLGMPFVQATITKDGQLNATIGAVGQKSMMSDQRWVDTFNAAGLPAVFEPKMALWLRCHVPLCVAFESVSVAGKKRNGGASWGEALALARGMHEFWALIQHLGYPIYPSAKAWINRSPAVVGASMLWTMSRITSFRELLATGANECRALVDTMADTASKADPPMQVPQIKAMKPASEPST